MFKYIYKGIIGVMKREKRIYSRTYIFPSEAQRVIFSHGLGKFYFKHKLKKYKVCKMTDNQMIDLVRFSPTIAAYLSGVVYEGPINNPSALKRHLKKIKHILKKSAIVLYDRRCVHEWIVRKLKVNNKITKLSQSNW